MTPSLKVVRSELTSAMASGRTGRAAANALCTSCVGLFDVDGAALSVVRDGTSSGTYGSSNETSKRLDEYQFTFGEGPCLDAVASRAPVLAPDLDSSTEHRWPVLREALLVDGIRSVFAVPVMVTSICVGALDLFRARPGPLEKSALAGAILAAELASGPLLDLIAESEALRNQNARALAAAEDEVESTDEMDRVEVYQASGMLIFALDVSPEQAMLRLRAHAMATGQTASQVARAILERRLELDRDDPTRWHDPDDLRAPEGDGTGRDPR